MTLRMGQTQNLNVFMECNYIHSTNYIKYFKGEDVGGSGEKGRGEL